MGNLQRSGRFLFLGGHYITIYLRRTTITKPKKIMKRIFTIAAALLMTASVWAQAPEKMSYQAVVRDAGDALVTTQAVGMQISILQTTATGTAVYVETQTPTTNINGLVSLEIGTGTLVSGDFTTIDWANDTYFIKTETDPTGGTTYTITGTSQLMSVPYALYAKTSGNGAGPQGPAGNDGIDGVDGAIGATGPQGPIGNDGAIGATGPQGPIGNDGAVGPTGATGITGADGIDGIDGAVGPTGADGQGGITNAGTGISVTGAGTSVSPYVVSTTESIYTIGLWQELGGYVFWVSANGKHGLVAETVDQGYQTWYEAQNSISNPSNHSGNGQKFRDWRMPTKYELNEMFLQQGAIGGFADDDYWSSTEFDSGIAWVRNNGGYQNAYSKDYGNYVRAVRAF
jgi:hypothetical protein